MNKKKEEALLMNLTSLFSLIIVCILTIVGFAVNFASSILGNNNLIIFCSLIIYIFIVFYIIYHFNKPHGNLIKYLILVFDLLVLCSLGYFYKENYDGVKDILSFITVLLMMFAAVVIPYMSGKLDKKKINIFIIIGVTVVFILFGISSDIYCYLNYEDILQVSGLSKEFIIFEYLTPWNLLIQWLAITFAYLSRYNEHIAAGKANPKKAKK